VSVSNQKLTHVLEIAQSLATALAKPEEGRARNTGAW
jgi:hypothetical protein